jgi:nucleoside-diphosphate-sugar epimerase
MARARKALITGIDGFTGRYMAAELAGAGYRVLGIGSGAEPGADDYRTIDLLDAAGLQAAIRDWEPELVVHLAAVAFVAHGDADAFYRVNLLGTRNLLQALADASARPDAVLLASSASVYGNASQGMLDETVPPAPANDYAVSKLAMEYMARLYADKLPLIITRPFNYTGVGQHESFLVPKIVAHFRRKAPVIELGNMDVSRDFGDVRTVVQAYRRLLEHPEAIGRTVNVCSGQAHSLREILDTCEAISGHRIRVEVNPAFVRDNEVKILCGDAGRLRALLGQWQPVALQDTLRWMLAAGAS